MFYIVLFMLSYFVASDNRQSHTFVVFRSFIFVMAFTSHHLSAEDTLSTVALTVFSV